MPGPSAPRSVPWEALLAVAAWGASFVATRVALDSWTPLSLVATRLVIGAVLLLGVSSIRAERILPEPADRGRSFLLGVILALHMGLQSYGLEYTSATHTAWIIACSPALIALGAHFLMDQPLRGVGWVGVALAALGVMAVTGSSPAGLVDAQWGDSLQLVSCLTWTAYTLLGMRPVRRSGALRVSAFAMCVAALLVLPPALARGVLRAPLTASTVAAIAFLGLVCSGVAFTLWFRAQRRHGPHRVGATLYLEPLVTSAIALALLGESVGETLGPLEILGGGLVLLGVWFVGKGASR